jgi:hypothetical protein
MDMQDLSELRQHARKGIRATIAKAADERGWRDAHDHASLLARGTAGA